jgi:uncharacterized protein
MRYTFQAAATALLLLFTASSGFAADAKVHRVAIQIDQNVPEIMTLVLNNAANMIQEYRSKGETVQIEVVAYGPGLHMLRADTSPVQDRIKQIQDGSLPSSITFSACDNTRQSMEKREGKDIAIIPQAHLVPSGAVRLIELQEQGWQYLKP